MERSLKYEDQVNIHTFVPPPKKILLNVQRMFKAVSADTKFNSNYYWNYLILRLNIFSPSIWYLKNFASLCQLWTAKNTNQRENFLIQKDFKSLSLKQQRTQKHFPLLSYAVISLRSDCEDLSELQPHKTQTHTHSHGHAHTEGQCSPLGIFPRWKEECWMEEKDEMTWLLVLSLISLFSLHVRRQHDDFRFCRSCCSLSFFKNKAHISF